MSSSGTAARDAAYQILRAVRRGSPFRAAQDHLAASLSDPDRRLAHEIAAGVLRARRQLDAALAPLLKGGWRRTTHEMRDVLRIGAYQLMHLSRVPGYAAVQATVDLARQERGERGAGLVNAVLRRLARERGPGPSGGPAESDVARRHSHPDWLVHRWLARFGPERTAALLAHNNRRPATVLQPVRWPRERLRAALAAAGIPVSDAPLGLGLAVAARRVAALPGYADGAFVVQDDAQAALLAFAAIPEGAAVWDACAAPGGKTAVLGTARRVVATDTRPRRMEILRHTVRRAAPGTHVARADARRPPLRERAMDAVLVDAPCSATGTMARHPDARWRLTLRRIERLAGLQRDVLEGACRAVRPGGLLVYLTCSLEPEENEEQVDAFLARHPEFHREGPDRRIFPSDHGTDGGYGARLRHAS